MTSLTPTPPTTPTSPADPSAHPAPAEPLAVAPVAMAPDALPRVPRHRRRWMRRLVIAGTLATLPLARSGMPRTDSAVAELPGLATEVTLAEEQLLLTMGAASEAHADTAVHQADEAAARAAAEAPAPMAEVHGVPLVVPAAAAETAVVGFHEANGGSTEPLTPTVPLDAVHNGGVEPHEGEAHPEQPTTLVLPSRARGSHAASAVDVAVPEGIEVTAPVSGEVVSVSAYSLYGKYADTRIEIVPDGRPDLRVIVLHVSDPLVSVGDAVVAGETPIAGTSTAFPFSSQIDRFTAAEHGEPTPHVHIEVKRTA